MGKPATQKSLNGRDKSGSKKAARAVATWNIGCELNVNCGEAKARRAIPPRIRRLPKPSSRARAAAAAKVAQETGGSSISEGIAMGQP
jgi:hypothetical protein